MEKRSGGEYAVDGMRTPPQFTDCEVSLNHVMFVPFQFIVVVLFCQSWQTSQKVSFQIVHVPGTTTVLTHASSRDPQSQLCDDLLQTFSDRELSTIILSYPRTDSVSHDQVLKINVSNLSETLVAKIYNPFEIDVDDVVKAVTVALQLGI